MNEESHKLRTRGAASSNIPGFFRRVDKIDKSDYYLRRLSVRLSVRPSEWKTWLPLEVFSWNLIFEYFSRICWEIQVSFRSEKITGILQEHVCTCILSRWVLLRMWNVSDKCFPENQNTHFMLNISENLAAYNVEKYCTARRATDDYMTHSHCVQDT